MFCDVARLRSFSQAATLNGITQSAASQIVHMLEIRMGGALIDRSTRPLHLTPLGQAYFSGCRKLVDEYLELEGRLREDRATLSATVVVAAIYSVGLGDMGQYQEQFRQMQPHAEVHLDYLHPDEVYQRVHDGTADFGLVSFPRKGRDLVVLPWREEPMVIACSPRHPLARLKQICPNDFDGFDCVAFTRDLVIRREIDRYLRGLGISLHVVLEFDNVENIKRAVENQSGLALLPEPTFRREVEVGTLVARPLHGSRFVRPLGVIYRKHHTLSAFAMRFMSLLRENSPPSFSDFAVRGRSRAADAKSSPNTTKTQS